MSVFPDILISVVAVASGLLVLVPFRLIGWRRGWKWYERDLKMRKRGFLWYYNELESQRKAGCDVDEQRVKKFLERKAIWPCLIQFIVIFLVWLFFPLLLPEDSLRAFNSFLYRSPLGYLCQFLIVATFRISLVLVEYRMADRLEHFYNLALNGQVCAKCSYDRTGLKSPRVPCPECGHINLPSFRDADARSIEQPAARTEC